MNWIRRGLVRVYQITGAIVRRLPGGIWLLGWTDPLHVARRCLRQELKKRVHYARGWMALPVQDGVFHTVLCNQVLEHVTEPSKLMAEVARVLRPGGVVLLTTPQTWGLHLEPHDFYRYTEYGLRYLAEKSGLEVVEVIPTCGLSATLAQRIADTVVYTEPNRRPPWLELSLSLLMAPVLMTGYGFDKLFGKRGDPLDHVLIARRPDDS
jgi:SAM-dependent methyltransferase